MKDTPTSSRFGTLKPNRLVCAWLSAPSTSVVETAHLPLRPFDNRLSLTKRICLSLIVGSFVSSAFGQTPPPDHPNIVVILADDLGYGDVGFNSRRGAIGECDCSTVIGSPFSLVHSWCWSGSRRRAGILNESSQLGNRPAHGD
jgi:hypothetical protein